MILPIRTSVIYTVLFRSYIESILFFDFVMSIFPRWIILMMDHYLYTYLCYVMLFFVVSS